MQVLFVDIVGQQSVEADARTSGSSLFLSHPARAPLNSVLAGYEKQ